MRNLGTTLTQHSYSASFGRLSRTSDNKTVAILTQIRDEEGNPLADHVWVKLQNFCFDNAPLKKGERIFFSAEPYRYIKGIYKSRAIKKLQSDIGLRNVIFFGRECQKN